MLVIQQWKCQKDVMQGVTEGSFYFGKTFKLFGTALMNEIISCHNYIIPLFKGTIIN